MNQTSRTIGLIFALLTSLIAGCSSPIVNLTLTEMSENPSGIYTISLSTKINNANLIKGSKRASIVINGETHEMQHSTIADDVFDFEYQMPPNTNTAKYYFIVEYDIMPGSKIKKHIKKHSELYDLKLINRYVLNLDSTRGPVGAEIGVLGQNFSKLDTVIFDNEPIDSTYHSKNSITFRVPPVPARQTYSVSVRTGSGADIQADNFRVDPSTIHVTPQNGDAIRIASGKGSQVLFSIDHEAPAQGLPIDVTTDIPESVIMKEVLIPEGKRSVNIKIEGGPPASGSLFVEALGYDLVEMPVEIY